MPNFGILSRVNSPGDLKILSLKDIESLNQEIREFLIEKVSATGGHLGPNLGVVELTVALHRVFDSPKDAIIFDTGHQSYVHKILTGRKDKFDSLRKEDGLSGYPSRSESEHDWVESSHASASLSYADGLSRAFQKNSPTRHVIAVIGDGALTGGMAWEALNNIAINKEAKIIVVINDNGRSYAPTTGGLADRLETLRLDPKYEKALGTGKNILIKLPLGKVVFRALHALKVAIKDMFNPQPLFSDLNIKYMGPVDGHDTAKVEKALIKAKKYNRPVIVHVLTQKGKGFTPAELNEEDQMHSTGVIDPITGEALKDQKDTWTDIYSEAILKIGQENEKVIAITAAMAGPTGLLNFANKYPDRFIDVGIAEQHALTCASGLAMGGFKPVVSLYSTFLNRAFDQLLMDIALIKQPVTIVLDRSGITGNDGASHHGMWDLSLLSIIPNIYVSAPRDANQLKIQLNEAIENNSGPTVVRFPKGKPEKKIDAIEKLDDGVEVLFRSELKARPKVMLIGVGIGNIIALDTVNILEQQNYSLLVVDPRWVLPVADSIIKLSVEQHLIVCIEDNGVKGGIGSNIENSLREAGIDVPFRTIGINQEFIAQADRQSILNKQGITGESIAKKIINWIDSMNLHPELQK